MCKLWSDEKVYEEELKTFMPQHFMVFKLFLEKKFKNVLHQDIEKFKYQFLHLRELKIHKRSDLLLNNLFYNAI